MRKKFPDMREIVGTISIFCFAELSGSCEKELDFKYRDIEPILVIEGALTQKGADVILTLTTPMDEPMDRNYLTDAEIMITDMESGMSYPLIPDKAGVYRSELCGEEGHSYLLKVERGGVTYTSESVMRPPVEITGMEFSWIKMPYDYVAVLQVSFTDDPSTVGEYYWMRVYRNGEAYKWAEISDMKSSGGVIDNVIMTTRKDLDKEDEADKLEYGDVVTATVVPVSQEMHDYLEALSIGNSNGPCMFEGGFCLGYFLASPVTEKEIVFNLD